MTALIEIRGLTLERGRHHLVRNLDLEIAPGECWGLLGRNGAGKTTLLLTLAGLLPAQGEIRLGGDPLENLDGRRRACRLGVLLAEQPAEFPLALAEAALAGRHPHLPPWGGPSATDRERVRRALARVGLGGRERQNIQTLSAGERQRAALATLLVQDPPLLLLDEPTSHQDLREQERVLGLLRGLADRGRGVLMSLHDPNQALRWCSHLLLLAEGRTLKGPTAVLGDAAHLSRLYGLKLRALGDPPRRYLIAEESTCP